MNNMNISDVEIEMLLIGKWRFNKDWEIIYVEFRNDMTYKQTRIKTFILSKPIELFIGNRFTGIWHINERRLCFNVKRIPQSFLNFKLPILTKVNFADALANIGSLFITEKYEVVQINSSKFTIMDQDKSFVGTKVN